MRASDLCILQVHGSRIWAGRFDLMKRDWLCSLDPRNGCVCACAFSGGSADRRVQSPISCVGTSTGQSTTNFMCSKERQRYLKGRLREEK